MPVELSKHYDPASIQKDVSSAWLTSGVLEVVPDDRPNRYVIMMPLPNVTGALHLGHAMDNVMQDLLIRWHRMQGDNTLWMPGTDHAGIATQAVVEKRLFELEGKTRHDLGREKLVERIWAWKHEYEQRIVSQQQAMGCSCAWKASRFTMDKVCARAVREAFFRLFQDRLIYRGNRLVNWDCFLRTAISDDEIVRETYAGHFWHIRYPILEAEEGEPTFVTVATTRPETMLGDTAVAVHPDPEGALNAALEALEQRLETASQRDREGLEAQVAEYRQRVETHLPRLKTLAVMAASGKKVKLPLLGREIPLILDTWAKPELGSGCVKITPAHDPNDYAVWQRHTQEIDIINVLNEDGTYNRMAGPYAGLDRKLVRERVVADLTAQGLLERVEDREIELGLSDRSKTAVEPFLSKQWFVRMGDVEGGIRMGVGTKNEFIAPGLAQAAIDAVKADYRSPTGRNLKFHPDPERYAGTYSAWLLEKRDWCISRQLWWGHRIPIWRAELTAETLRQVVSLAEANAQQLCVWVADHDGHPVSARSVSGEGPFETLVCLRHLADEPTLGNQLEAWGLARDADVLDTWFSSALWPFSTLGWPDPSSAEVNAGQQSLAPEGRPDFLTTYYPGSCLVTGRDIITLWVARMQMMGLYALGDVPFTDCFIHATILDGKGERMSKSKGNGIDPVDIVDQYGVDALRYVLCEMQTGTQDVKLPVQAVSPFTGKPVDLATAKHGRSIFTYLDPETGQEFDVLGTIKELPKSTVTSDRFDLGRAFCTKLWNAARFAFMNLGEHTFTPLTLAELPFEDRWILHRLSLAMGEVHAHIEEYNPSAAIGAARDFFWNELCDWYLELIKPRFRSGVGASTARSVLALALDQVLRLFHPFVPFITEALWAQLRDQVPVRGLETPLDTPHLLMKALWPRRRPEWENPELEADFALLKEAVRALRELRSSYQVPPSRPLQAVVKGRGIEAERLTSLSRLIQDLTALTSLTVGEDEKRPPLAAFAAVGSLEFFVLGALDPEKERAKLNKQQEKLTVELEKLEKKLANPGFVEKAPPAVVETERKRLADLKTQLELLKRNLAELA